MYYGEVYTSFENLAQSIGDWIGVLQSSAHQNETRLQSCSIS